ncbi:beta-mannosidase-like [Panonychus citri]|uniref:beta-mannosidase-like n=1 Tax=Panonychus citri TaxID=50023 RepID=UPI002307E800|nr:beta-mannosidase-like [Panonychus citri]
MMLNFLKLLLINSIIFSCNCKYISLNSNDWTLNDNLNLYTISNVTVPGGLYTDLQSAGLIVDPLYDNNDINYRNFSKLDWSWTRQFKVEAEDLKQSNEIYLIVNGVDTISRIYINGHYIGQTSNMFIKYSFNINGHLYEGDNLITIAIESAVSYAKGQSDDYKGQHNYTIVPECWPDVYHGECHSNFIRKMAASFSWDWGPAFPGSGIWLPIGIEIVQSPVQLDSFWTSIGESIDSQEWILNLTLTILRPIDEREVSVVVKLSTDQELDGKYERELTIYSGLFGLDSSRSNYPLPTIKVTSSRVALWWPNGMKIYSNSTIIDRPRALYNLTVTIQSSEADVQSKSKQIGFRRIRLIQEKPEAGKILRPNGKYDKATLPGLSFRFEVNGVPLFIKGTNVIPTSIFPENESRDKDYVHRLLSTVSYSSMNMIRIWGGGIYQTDYFYDLADQLGILIWQDFMFACMTYPTDQSFLDNVKDEVTQQVTRLSHHPSIALWSGNNEDETAIATGWWPELAAHFTQYVDDYLKLNRDTIKVTVQQLDPGRIFVSSSPSNGDETEAEGGLAVNPGDYLFGDVHFYSYDVDAWNQSKYPEARFISEYGFESYSSLSSYAKVIPMDKLVYPLTDSLESRQHHPNGTLEMEAMIANYFKLPSEKGNLIALRKMIYLSQCLQAIAVKLETQVYLRNRKVDQFTGTKLTWGAMYWMLNDIWVSTSWSSLEFGGKWKMLQYYIRKIFNPIHGQIYLTNDHNNGNQLIETVINNDFTGTVKLRVTINVHQLDSFEFTSIVSGIHQIESYDAKLIYSLDVNQSIIRSKVCPDISNCLIRLTFDLICSDDSVNCDHSDDDSVFLVKPNELQLSQSSNLQIASIVQVDYQSGSSIFGNGKSNCFKIHLIADYPVLFVWIDFKMDSIVDGVFSQNGFHLFEPEIDIYLQASNQLITVDDVYNSLIVTHLAENM